MAGNELKTLKQHWEMSFETALSLTNYNDLLYSINFLETAQKKKKLSKFDLKSWVSDRTIIRPGILSNCRIFESNWLEMSSQFYSNIP